MQMAALPGISVLHVRTGGVGKYDVKGEWAREQHPFTLAQADTEGKKDLLGARC